MEKVHNSKNRPWIAQKIILKDFRDKYSLIINDFKKAPSVKNLMSKEECSEIEQICGLENMTCKYQNFAHLSVDLRRFKIPDDMNLKTVKLRQEDMLSNKLNPQDSSAANMKNPDYPSYQIIKEDLPDVEFCPIDETDVLLAVQIFRPERSCNVIDRHNLVKQPAFQVEMTFFVLGSQYLSELRDKIDCISDRAIPGDFSENPHFVPERTCKDIYKSGFFYINGVFYNDMRYPDCKDYSEIIMNWSKAPGREVGPFTQSLMEKTKFIDLDIQLGYPYVYLHQGNCEHVIVFTDLMKYSNTYCENRNQYPMPVVLKSRIRIMCMVCQFFVAEWVVYGSKRVLETPFYFCKECFLSFNYDEQGEKIGEFSAYFHIDRSAIV